MADASKYLAVRRLVTNSSTFVPIVAPITCSQIVIENGDGTNAQIVRSDPNDPATEKGVPANLELTFRASASCWNIGDTICHVKASAGGGPAIVSFLL